MQYTDWNNEQGFTLVELMVVVLIIGILAMIAIPIYKSYVPKTQVSEAFPATSELRKQVRMTYQQKGNWPMDHKKLGFKKPTQLGTKYISSIQWHGRGSFNYGDDIPGEFNNSIVVRFNHNAAEGVAGNRILIAPRLNPNKNMMEWYCYYSDIDGQVPAKYLPGSCIFPNTGP